MIRQAILAAAAALLLLPAAAAAAPDTVIDFESISPGAQIEHEYAASGVLFGKAQDFGLPAAARECPLPKAVAGGISGTSAKIGCIGGKEFSDRSFNTAFEFTTERRAVRFKLSQRVADAARSADVRVYAIAGVLLEQRTVSLARNALVDVAFSRATSEIAAVVISGALDLQSTDDVLLDDIVATMDDQPPEPKFSLALNTPLIEIVEGASAETPVSIRRFNGSSGPVDISVGALPAGISAAHVQPNPLTGRNPAALRITAARPLSGQRQLTLTASGGASAGAPVGAQLVQTVTGIPAVQIPEGGRSPIRLVPGCGQQSVDVGFSVRGGFSDFVGIYAARETGGLTASTQPSWTIAAGDGFYPVKMLLDPGGRSDGGGQFEFGVTPSLATPASVRLDWLTDRVRIDRADPNPVSRPLVDGGATVTVVGNFPRRCAVSFLDGAGQPWDARSRDQVDVDGRPLDRFVLAVPSTAVSGPLRAVSPTRIELARVPVEVTDFRNVYALSGTNGGDGAGAPDYTWAEFERTFGTDDTESCFVFCVRDPVAVQHYDLYRERIKAYGGLCGGWTMMALRFRGFTGERAPLSQFSSTARRAYDIAPLTDGTAIKREIVRWQVAQHDKSFAAHNLAQAKLPAGEERLQITELIRRNGGALLTIYQGDKGHAVVAYAAEKTPAGGLKLAVYDPNLPYSPAEETDRDTRASRLVRSTITIGSDGSWRGSNFDWTGFNDSLRVVTFLPRENASLPSTFSLASLVGSAAGPPPASVSSIRARGTEALAPDGTGRAGSGVTVQPGLSGGDAPPSYQLTPGREYAMTIRGAGSGRYQHGLLGRGAAATVRGATTSPGQLDRVTVRPGAAQLGFATGAPSSPVTYDLADEAGRSTRTALIRITARKGARDEARLGRGVLRLAHDGAPTFATVTLGSVGEGLPGGVTTASLKVGRGERLELRPRSWRDVAAGVSLTVRDSRGRVLRRAKVRLVETKAVAIEGVAARRRATKVTVAGRVTRRGTDPVLAATVELMRGTKVVRRRSATRRGADVKTGRFSLPIAIGRVGKGTRLRVTVTLLDEAAGLSGVRRTVRVRR